MLVVNRGKERIALRRIVYFSQFQAVGQQQSLLIYFCATDDEQIVAAGGIDGLV